MSNLSPLKLWSSVFALWGLILSGAFAGFVGSPGVIQAVRLRSVLQAKHDQLAKMRAETQQLETEAEQLEGSKVAQQREIRRILGYTASDEIIFDFTRDGDLAREGETLSQTD